MIVEGRNMKFEFVDPMTLEMRSGDMTLTVECRGLNRSEMCVARLYRAGQG